LIGDLNKVLFVVSHASPDISIEPVDAVDIARRMVHSLQYEQSGFMGYYRMFRFAFPERANEVIDSTEQRQNELLQRALAGREAYAVYHPYPVSLPALFDAVAPYCDPSEVLTPQLPQLTSADEGCKL
jgi:hypothetical protein